MANVSYADAYRDIDFRAHPELYRIGKGEQGVLIAEPYKSEILPHWKFATQDAAQTSANKIFMMFEKYGANNDFVGMDMSRKFLQMGFTRARRYANHASGRKYDDGEVRLQDQGSEDSEKAASARVFKEFYDKARTNELYLRLRDAHKKLELSQKRK